MFEYESKLCGWYNTAANYCTKISGHPSCLGNVKVCKVKDKMNNINNVNACRIKDKLNNIDTDNVNHPSHYTQGNIEVIDVILDWKLSYCLSNAIKYIARCEYKNNKVEDIKKAIWYLNREIEETEKGE